MSAPFKSCGLLMPLHSLKLLDLAGAFAFRHTAPVPFMRMRLIVFLLIYRRPVVKLGDGILQNLRDRAVKLPGNSHRQSEYETAPDQFFRCVSPAIFSAKFLHNVPFFVCDTVRIRQ